MKKLQGEKKASLGEKKNSGPKGEKKI